MAPRSMLLREAKVTADQLTTGHSQKEFLSTLTTALRWPLSYPTGRRRTPFWTQPPTLSTRQSKNYLSRPRIRVMKQPLAFLSRSLLITINSATWYSVMPPHRATLCRHPLQRYAAVDLIEGRS